MRRLADGRSLRSAPLRGRAARSWCAAALIVALLGAAGWLGRSGSIDDDMERLRLSAMNAAAALGLQIRRIRIFGNRRVSRAEILAAAGLRIGAPILAFDPEEVRDRLHALPWIRRAEVSRRLPGTARIEIEERRPYAIWQRGGRQSLIDSDGVSIAAVDLLRFSELPVIVSPRQPLAAKRLFETVSTEPDLGGRVRAVVRVGERRWDLWLDNGVAVHLPETGEAAAWRGLAQLERRHALLARRIVAVDLRIPGRVVVRRKGAAEDLAEARR